jgi:hypothetical protein
VGIIKEDCVLSRSRSRRISPWALPDIEALSSDVF